MVENRFLIENFLEQDIFHEILLIKVIRCNFYKCDLMSRILQAKKNDFRTILYFFISKIEIIKFIEFLEIQKKKNVGEVLLLLKYETFLNCCSLLQP